MPKNIPELSTSKSLAILISTSTEGSGHFENTMLVTERFLIEMQWNSTCVWLIFEQTDMEELEQEIQEKVARRLLDLFLSKRIPCIPSVYIWSKTGEISTEDLIVITGGIDISTVQPVPFTDFMGWNTNLIPPNARYLIQCQPLWWNGEKNKWEGSDQQDQLTYVNGAKSGIWRLDGDLEYDDEGDLETLSVVEIPTPETLPQRVIRPVNYLELNDLRLSNGKPEHFNVVMYGNFPAGSQYEQKQLQIYEEILKSLRYIANKGAQYTIDLTRIASQETQEKEAKSNKKYASDNFIITPKTRLPRPEFQALLCRANLMMSEGQNIENECVCLHVPVFQWRTPVASNNDYNFLPEAFQNLEIQCRTYLNEHTAQDIDDFNPEPSGEIFLRMMLEGIGEYSPNAWEGDKLTILLNTLTNYLSEQD